MAAKTSHATHILIALKVWDVARTLHILDCAWKVNIIENFVTTNN